MTNCKNVTRLLSERYERTLTLRERLTLMAHLAMCRGCANYGRHMEFLRAATGRLREGRGSGGQ